MEYDKMVSIKLFNPKRCPIMAFANFWVFFQVISAPS